MFELEFARVFGDHRHDLVTFDVACADGHFSLQFTTGTDHPTPVWNAASNPPTDSVDGYDVLEQGETYIILASNAETAEEAAREAEEVLELVGGEYALIESANATTIYKGLPEAVSSFGKWLRAAVRTTARRALA